MPKIIENVREQLLCVAKKQIEERGYANTTIRSVAGECGLAVGTVYNYFKSKDMLIATFVVEDWNSYLSDIRSAKFSDPQQTLHNIYDALIHFSEKHKSLFSDPEAAKVYSAVFSERHKTLRGQISEIVAPLCHAENGEFTAEFVAESLLTWTVAGKDFDSIFNILKKILK
jgi:AcrR family transcriptional regulator